MNLLFPRSLFIVIHEYLRTVVIPTASYLALGRYADLPGF